MIATLQIRPAVPADASSIAFVLYQSFIAYKSSYTPEGFAATTPKAEVIEARMIEGPIWVVLSDQVVVGTVSVVPRGESLYIRMMAVLPLARGQHIGERLLVESESFATAHGCSRLFLSTTPFLSAAIHLYEGFGFQRTNEGQHDLFGTPIFTMEKFLDVQGAPAKF